MKKMFIGLLVLSSFSAFADDIGAKLKSCQFSFADINYELVDLSSIPTERGHFLYISKTEQEIMGEELRNEMPAIVVSKRKNVTISYPIINIKGDVEINQSIKVSLKNKVSDSDSEIVFKATMNTMGFKDEGICHFSK